LKRNRRYLIHSPFFARDSIELQSAWRQFEKLKTDGKVRSIGASNFSINHLTAILDIATVKPAVNQIKMHPYLQQKEMRDFANKHGIQVTAYGPLASLSKVPGGPVDGVVLRLAEKQKVSEGTVLLRWATQNGVTVVTTSRDQSRLEEYVHLEDWQLEESDLNDIDGAGRIRHFLGFFTRELEG
jgi:diketogulonate reductase-like aldo/keto reductase